MAYQEVNITSLQPGSFVVEVMQQTGDISVKHAGWVRTWQAIELLKIKGVVTVLIDTDKKLEPETAPDLQPEAEDKTERLLFAEELPRARKILQQTVKTQKHLFNTVRRDKAIDLSLVHEVSAGLSDSVSRNQDVLLYLSRIAEQSDKLLQHSVNCAIYIAAFARILNQPSHKIQSLITAALLHDIGKVVNPEPLQQPDHLAINTSLGILQKTPQLSGEVSLWISQHCAHLDGSGAPKISGAQIEKGSRMLAIVNNYEKLTNPAQTKTGPLAASRTLLDRTPHQLDAELLQWFIKCIGIYPPGSVVRLNSGRLALVLENNPKKPTSPRVKVFYHAIHQHHLPARTLDLSRMPDEQIEACVDLKKYGLELKNYL
ncbi:DUF3391 domain-containing protein [Chromatiaceae bacterium AAb-1]|nr:DUF3391 domain-containing protein [Chromatiaceae bacterium AAb-1]